MKFGQVIRYNNRNIFLLKIIQKMRPRRLVADRSLFFRKVLFEVKTSGLQLNFNIF